MSIGLAAPSNLATLPAQGTKKQRCASLRRRIKRTSREAVRTEICLRLYRKKGTFARMTFPMQRVKRQ